MRNISISGWTRIIVHGTLGIAALAFAIDWCNANGCSYTCELQFGGSYMGWCTSTRGGRSHSASSAIEHRVRTSPITEGYRCARWTGRPRIVSRNVSNRAAPLIRLTRLMLPSA